MTFAKAMVLLAFLAVFAAGTTSGLFVYRMSPKPVETPASRPHGQGSFLRGKLDLSDEQQTKMAEVWRNFREHTMARDQARRQLSQQRDKDLIGLLTAEQKVQYDGLLARYEADVQKLREETDAERRQDDERTRAILSPEQQKKYEELVKGERESRGPRGGPGSRPSSSRGFGGFGPGGGGGGAGGAGPDGLPH